MSSKKSNKIWGFIVCLLSLSACNDGADSSVTGFDYLPVQIEEGDNWSIIDSNGKIIVEEEYSSKDILSRIYNEKVYWVKSGSDDKFRLFSINSPKKPINKGLYEEISNFDNGLAFVVPEGLPIQLINTNGKVIKELPRNIIKVGTLNNGMAEFMDITGKWGYLNSEGEIAIDAMYDYSSSFGDEVALVRNGNDDWQIIDKRGKTKATIDPEIYEINKYIYSEGLIPVFDKQNQKLIYLNKEGKTELILSDKYKYGEDFMSGFAIVKTGNFDYAVIDNKGENMIRTGKYSNIRNMGNGKFIAKKNNKYGYIDKDDNVIINFEYSSLYPLLPDNAETNYICSQSSTYFLIDETGEEIKKTEYAEIGGRDFYSVTFTDYESIAKTLVADVEIQGYKPIIGREKVSQVAEIYSLNKENYHPYTRDIYLAPIYIGTQKVDICLEFTTSLQKEKTHKETVNDGWFTEEKVVRDGWEWNDEAIAERIIFNIDTEDVNKEKLRIHITKQLESKGFETIKMEKRTCYYEAKNGNRYARVTLYDNYNELILNFLPFHKTSEKDK